MRLMVTSISDVMSRKEFENRTALVTGGSRGIGRAVCLALAESGARVAINYTSDEKAAAATLADVETRGARAIAVKADVSDPDAVSEMVAAVENELLLSLVEAQQMQHKRLLCVQSVLRLLVDQRAR